MKKRDLTINTIIGSDTVIHGDVTLKGNIIVYGSVLGSVNNEASIRVAVGADVKGAMTGGEIYIGGNVVGDINAAGKVTLGNEAKLHGDVKAGQFVIEEGAFFEGKCDMHNSSRTKKNPTSKIDE